MSRRALLTDREREVLRGDADDVEDLAAYHSKIRTRLRYRLDNLERDLQLLRDLDEPAADRIEELVCGNTEDKIRELEQRIERLEADR